MLEVLIAILILSFGLFGMLGLLINSLKLSASSNHRTVAGQQAYSIAEVLRANPELIVAIDRPTPAFTASCTKAAGCENMDYLQTTFALWRNQLATVLPSGDGTICRDSTPEDSGFNATDWKCDSVGQFVVKICWNESNSPSAVAGEQCTWTNL